MSDAAFAIIMVVLLILAFFFPTTVAYNRRHRNRTAIFVVNIFFGLTLLGWVGALVWACTDNVEEKVRP